MTSHSISPPELWPEPWAIQVAVDADRIECRLRRIRSDGIDNAQLRSSEEAVTYHLEAARTACKRSSGRRPRGVGDRWRGASVEQAYRNLHSAKISMVDILPDPELAALVPAVCARMAAALDRNDPRRTGAEKAMQSSDPAMVRAALKQAMEASYDASDEEYVRLRDFRNIILATAALLAVFTGLLLLAVASSPNAIPLCFAPGVTGSATPGSGGEGGRQVLPVCPSGNQQSPTSGDVLIIAGLGAVGGSLGALLAMGDLRGTSTPYGVTMALAVLKVPSGALIAVIGVLLLAGGFVPGLSNLDSQRQILAYALLFGYAQQLITRLADGQAQTILNRLPSKDPEAVQPVVATPTLPVALTPDDQRGNGTRWGTETNGTPVASTSPSPAGGNEPAPTRGTPSLPAQRTHPDPAPADKLAPTAVDHPAGPEATRDQRHDPVIAPAPGETSPNAT